MSTFYAGFARADVTPPLGIGIAGYFNQRDADKILDPLELNALALRQGEATVIMIALDQLSISNDVCDSYRQAVSHKTGVPTDAVFIHATHTHTGPYGDPENILSKSRSPEALARAAMIEENVKKLTLVMAETAQAAIDDLKPAKVGYGISKAPNIAFIRRYRMADGTIRTNPGVNNPDIVEPIGQPDERLNVLRFDREGGKSIALINFGDHPDTVGGCNISADWPGFARRELEKALGDTLAIVFNGAQGDVNHINVHPEEGYYNNNTAPSGTPRGQGHARFMGRVVAGGVLQVWDILRYIDEPKLKYAQKLISLPSNMPTEKDDMEKAHYYRKLHLEGRDSEIPGTGMARTTLIAEAMRLCRLEQGPESYEQRLSAVTVGDVAFLGVRGEPFTGIGTGIKEAPGWGMVCPCCLTNGAVGYIPTYDAYAEGGYEAKTSNLKAGCAELIIEEAKKLLDTLR